MLIHADRIGIRETGRNEKKEDLSRTTRTKQDITGWGNRQGYVLERSFFLENEYSVAELRLDCTVNRG